MINLMLLEDDDLVLGTDWCRPLYVSQEGYSDSIFFESVYSGNPINNYKWCRVSQIYGPMWFNKPVRDLNGKYAPYEFVRGDITKSHLYGPTKLELADLYKEYLMTHVFTYGKYKEYTFWDVYNLNNQYFEWAVSKSLVKSKEEFITDYHESNQH